MNSSIDIDGTRDDVIGTGISGSGNITGKNIQIEDNFDLKTPSAKIGRISIVSIGLVRHGHYKISEFICCDSSCYKQRPRRLG
jgi:hypothetical protein